MKAQSFNKCKVLFHNHHHHHQSNYQHKMSHRALFSAVFASYLLSFSNYLFLLLLSSSILSPQQSLSLSTLKTVYIYDDRNTIGLHPIDSSQFSKTQERGRKYYFDKGVYLQKKSAPKYILTTAAPERQQQLKSTDFSLTNLWLTLILIFTLIFVFDRLFRAIARKCWKQSAGQPRVTTRGQQLPQPSFNPQSSERSSHLNQPPVVIVDLPSAETNDYSHFQPSAPPLLDSPDSLPPNYEEAAALQEEAKPPLYKRN